MLKKSPETYLSINQSDRSLYSMLVDAFVVKFLNKSLVGETDAWFEPKTFASEPHGGILTQSWLVVVKVLHESDSNTLQVNAETLEKSKDLIESIAGHTLLWALSNYASVQRRKKNKL